MYQINTPNSAWKREKNSVTSLVSSINYQNDNNTFFKLNNVNEFATKGDDTVVTIGKDDEVTLKRFKNKSGKEIMVKTIKNVLPEQLSNMKQWCENEYEIGSIKSYIIRENKKQLYNIDMIMDYYNAGSLFEYMEKVRDQMEGTRWSLKAALTHLKIVRETIIVLQNIHARGWIHWDIKAENVLLSLDYVNVDKKQPPNTKAAFCDFEYARKISSLTKSPFKPGEIIQGTKEFLAPEMISSAKGIVDGVAVDLFNLGLLLADLFCCLKGGTFYRYGLDNKKVIKVESFFDAEDENFLSQQLKQFKIGKNFNRQIIFLLKTLTAQDPAIRHQAKLQDIIDLLDVNISRLNDLLIQPVAKKQKTHASSETTLGLLNFLAECSSKCEAVKLDLENSQEANKQTHVMPNHIAVADLKL